MAALKGSKTEENLKAAELTLSADDLTRIAEVLAERHIVAGRLRRVSLAPVLDDIVKELLRPEQPRVGLAHHAPLLVGERGAAAGGRGGGHGGGGEYHEGHR